MYISHASGIDLVGPVVVLTMIIVMYIFITDHEEVLALEGHTVYVM